MKSIRITTAKTRKGVLNWLAKLNPMNTQHKLAMLDESNAVAVHVHKQTGQILFWELPSGVLIAQFRLKLVTKAA